MMRSLLLHRRCARPLLRVYLKRIGTDPATASSIFLTTATNVASMGMLLGLAAVLVK